MRDSRFRRTTRRLVTSDRVADLVRSGGHLEEVVDRFIAGDHPAEAIVVALDRDSKGLDVSFTQAVGSSVNLPDPDAITADYLEVVRLAAASGLKGFDVSVSAHGLGLDVGDVEGARERIGRVASAVEGVGAHITMGMGRADQIEETLDLARSLRPQHPGLGITLQANLRRSARDLSEFLAEGSRVRVVKGAYQTPVEERWDTSHQVDRAYVRMLRTLMESPATPLVASHDPRIVSITHELVRRSDRSRDDYEFQMLMGVRPLEHRRLVDTGRPLRVSIPYGQAWYDYLADRVIDNPDMLRKVLRQFLSRR